MYSPKEKIMSSYIRYRTLKRKYHTQNFWLLITAFLLLISLSMLTITPWIFLHYILFVMAGTSLMVCLINLIKYGGFICPRQLCTEKCRYYSVIDDVVDELIVDDEMNFIITSIHAHDGHDFGNSLITRTHHTR